MSPLSKVQLSIEPRDNQAHKNRTFICPKIKLLQPEHIRLQGADPQVPVKEERLSIELHPV